MEAKSKKKYYILAILAIIILAILIVPNFVVSSIKKVAQANSSKLESDSEASTVVILDQNIWRKYYG